MGVRTPRKILDRHVIHAWQLTSMTHKHLCE